MLQEEKVVVAEKDKKLLQGGSETIMLVDDEKDIVVFAKDALEKFGYKFLPFSNVVQAFQEFKLHPEQFDIVITGMTMPYMTGTELAHKDKAYAMGIAGYLEKPISMKDLIRKVRKVLSKKQNS